MGVVVAVMCGLGFVCVVLCVVSVWLCCGVFGCDSVSGFVHGFGYGVGCGVYVPTHVGVVVDTTHDWGRVCCEC